MELNGIRLVPVLVAAIAIYAVGFVTYGLLVPPESWMQWSGITEEEMNVVGTSRMPLSPVMPLMIALGVAVVLKWRAAGGGAVLGAWPVPRPDRHGPFPDCQGVVDHA